MPVTELIERWGSWVGRVPRWALAVLLVGCLGAAALLVFGGEDRPPPVGSVGAFASPVPSAAPLPVAGPRASTTPVRRGDDLSRVCEGWFYPGAPRYRGGAPHQISIGVRDQAQDREHRIKAALDVPYTVKERTRAAWMPEDPAKSQLMACLTLAGTGSAVKACPDEITLKRGSYVLTVYEVATGRRLAERKVDGDVLRCPNAVPLGTGGTVATTVSDRQLYKLLEKYVVSQSTVSRR